MGAPRTRISRQFRRTLSLTPKGVRSSPLSETSHVTRSFDQKTPFELVPGKDPNAWGFVLEPYGWAMGLDGDVDVRRLPTMNVNVDAKKILQSLDWAIFARGEIRKGRWGLLGDGFYAELSGSGNLGGRLYESASLNVQQGLASLALAYRIIDDRRGFLDFYAGARYNYLGVSISATVDESGIEEIGNNLTQRIANQIGARARSALGVEEQKVETKIVEEEAIVSEDVRILEEDVRDRIIATVESDIEKRLRQDLANNSVLRDALRDAEILRVSKGVRSEAPRSCKCHARRARGGGPCPYRSPLRAGSCPR